MKKNSNFNPLMLAITAALAAPTLTGCARAQVNNPTAAKQYQGELTGKVKWIHDSTWWFVLQANKAAPDAPKLVGPDLKIGMSWNGPGKPNLKQHDFIKSLAPGQKISIKVVGKPNGDLILTGAPAIKADNAATSKPNSKNSAAQTDPNAKSGLNGYYQKLMFGELNGLPIKRWLYSKDEAKTQKIFNLQKVAGAQGKTETFVVEGQPFENATRVIIEQKPKLFWHLNWTGFDKIGAQKGDLLWGVIYYRVTRAPEGAGELQIILSQEINGKWDQLSIESASPVESQEWKRYYFQTRAKGDGQVRLWNNVGSVPQTVEFGGVALVNLGPDVDGNLLPKNKLNLNYAGREQGAQWRVDAHRKNSQRRFYGSGCGRGG